MMTPPAPAMNTGHPLAGSLAPGTVHERWFRIEVGPPRPSLAAMCRDRASIGDAVRAEAALHGSSAADIGASFLLGRTAWRLFGPMAVSYLATNRIPLLDPDTVGVRLTGLRGAPATVTLGTTVFAALPDDPSRSHPDARPVANQTELRTVFRRTAAQVAGELIAALRPWARRSDNTQWGALSDALTTTLRWAGRAVGHEQAGLTQAEQLLDGTPPFSGRARLRRDKEDAREAYQIRNVCCLAYRLDTARYCRGCPLEMRTDSATCPEKARARPKRGLNTPPPACEEVAGPTACSPSNAG